MIQFPLHNYQNNCFCQTIVNSSWLMIYCTVCESVLLTHFSPMFHFYTSLKTSENLWFSDVFRGYKNAAVGWNGLKNCKMQWTWLLGNVDIQSSVKSWELGVNHLVQMQKFSKKHILLPDMHTHLCLSSGKNVSFPEKFTYLLNEWYPTIFTSNVLIGRNQINLNKMKDAIWDPT